MNAFETSGPLKTAEVKARDERIPRRTICTPQEDTRSATQRSAVFSGPQR